MKRGREVCLFLRTQPMHPDLLGLLWYKCDYNILQLIKIDVFMTSLTSAPTCRADAQAPTEYSFLFTNFLLQVLIIPKSHLTFGRQGLHFSPMTWILSLGIFPPALQSPEPYPPSCKLNLVWHRGVLTLHLKLWPQRWALLHEDSQHVPSQGHIVLAPLWQQGNWGGESENFNFRRDSWVIPMSFLLYEKDAWEENEVRVWFHFFFFFN